jgi:hypothetical protein
MVVIAALLWPMGPAVALPFAPLALPEPLSGMQVMVSPAPPTAAEVLPATARPGNAIVLASLGATPVRVAETPRARPARADELSLQRLEEQMVAGNRLIADMLARVSAMEREVAELRARVHSLPGAAPARPAAPEAARVEPTTQPRATGAAADGAAERHKRQQLLIDNGLLLLAAGVLLLLVGVAYSTWGRPALKDRLRESRLGRPAQPAGA